MKSNERTYTDEETHRILLEGMRKILPRLLEDATLLENMFFEDVNFDPNDSAEIFDKPEMTLREYFESELKNLHYGMTFFKGDKLESTIYERYAIIAKQLDKVFRPEKFIIKSIDQIIVLLNVVKRSLSSRDIKDKVSLNLPTLVNQIHIFNKFLKRVKGLNINPIELKLISDINDELQKIPAPLIEL